MKVLGIAGWSGSGKTTLIEQLVPCLLRRGLVVSLVKHAHHAFDLDQPGKDSYRHREAGCREVLISSSRRWALMHELRGAPEPTLEETLGHFSPCDLVLVEGFRHAAVPKIEVYRPSHLSPPIHATDPHVIAVATDGEIHTALPKLDLNDAEAVARFVVLHLKLTARVSAAIGAAS
jgi:molybdopterin-guanine dinucleotide biosynthesis protein B